MSFTTRPIGTDEVTEFRTNLNQGFGADIKTDSLAEGNARFTALVDLDRTYASFDADTMVGTAAAFTFDVAIPGGSTAMGGLTMVTVRPTHTRRGVLREMMTAHIADVRDRGEPLSGLWASESSIYGRFGFGLAAERVEASFDARHVGFPDGPARGEVRLISPEEAAKVLPAIYERAFGQRPGMLSRSDQWWEHERLHDPEEWRDGATARRFAVLSVDGEDAGYAMYRQKEKWEGSLPDGAVRVAELIAVDAGSRLALWRFLASIDLFPNVSHWNSPTDDELAWQVADPRRITRKVVDGLYLRPVDVVAAMEARAYLSSGKIVIGLHDRADPGAAAVYRLEVSSEGAACARTSEAPDVEMNVHTLGTLYLGGRHTFPLASAGAITGTDRGIALLDRLLAWHVTPWCPEVF
ncbi:MAG: GNAT family N-acetyltransferase [Acidimicrobiia bacterium]